MQIWLVLTMLAAGIDAVHVPCLLQSGAEWNPGGVSAIECNAETGFFVPSLEFRGLLDPRNSEPYKLLEREHALALRENEALEGLVHTSERVAERWKDYAGEIEQRWVQAEDALSSAEVDGRSAWYESPLFWFPVGLLLGAGFTAYVFTRSRI